MIKIFRYNTISSLPGVMNLQEFKLHLHTKFTESIADVSYFQPTSESVKNLRAGDINLNSFYDFPDGVDTGMKIPKARDRRSDISEISTEVRKQAEELTEKLSDAKKVSEKIKKFNEKHSLGISSTSDTSDTSSTSGTK